MRTGNTEEKAQLDWYKSVMGEEEDGSYRCEGNLHSPHSKSSSLIRANTVQQSGIELRLRGLEVGVALSSSHCVTFGKSSPKP